MSFSLVSAIIEGENFTFKSKKDIYDIENYIDLFDRNNWLKFYSDNLYELLKKNAKNDEVVIQAILGYLAIRSYGRAKHFNDIAKARGLTLESSSVLERVFSLDITDLDLEHHLESLREYEFDWNSHFSLKGDVPRITTVAEILAENVQYDMDLMNYSVAGVYLRIGRKSALNCKNENFLKICDFIHPSTEQTFKALIQSKSYVDAFQWLIDKGKSTNTIHDYLIFIGEEERIKLKQNIKKEDIKYFSIF